MAKQSQSGHIGPYTPLPEKPNGDNPVRGLMRRSRQALAATIAAARAHSEDGIAWLVPRATPEGEGDVVWLRSRAERPAGSRGKGLAGGRRLAAVLGAGCLLSGIAPEAARAPIGVAYAAVDPIVLDHALPSILAPVDVEPFAQMMLRPSHEVEPEMLSEPERADEILRFGTREVPRRLVATILRAALATDVDPVYLMALADKESGFDPDAKAATSSAEGLFQFIDSTWLETVRAFGAKHGLAQAAAAIDSVDGRATVRGAALRARILDLRCDPYIAAVMAAEMLKRDRADIAIRVGRDLTRTELYLAHFLGPQDAARFIALYDGRRKQNAARVFKAAAKANRAIFFARKGRRSTGLAVGDVYGRLDAMIDHRVARFQNVMAFADARL